MTNYKTLTTTLFTLVLFLGIPARAHSETVTDNKVDKLIILYADGEYEKCIDKGLRYLEKDEYKRSAVVNLYVAMSYFSISRSDLASEYPRAFKKSLRYASKYAKYRDRNDYVPSLSEERFMEELFNYTFEAGLNEYDAGEVKKCRNFIRYVNRTWPESSAGWMVRAMCSYELRNRRGARMALETVDYILDPENFEDKEDIDDIERIEGKPDPIPEDHLIERLIVLFDTFAKDTSKEEDDEMLEEFKKMLEERDDA